jgi:hypothetical protein
MVLGVEVRGEWRVRRRGRLKGGGSEGERRNLSLSLSRRSLFTQFID